MATPQAPPEPHSPMWLPALGAALFIVVGIWWAMKPASKEAEDIERPPEAAATKAADAGAAAPEAGAIPEKNEEAIRKLLELHKQQQQK